MLEWTNIYVLCDSEDKNTCLFPSLLRYGMPGEKGVSLLIKDTLKPSRTLSSVQTGSGLCRQAVTLL